MANINYSDFEEICVEHGYTTPRQSKMTNNINHNDIPIFLNIKCQYPKCKKTKKKKNTLKNPNIPNLFYN